MLDRAIRAAVDLERAREGLRTLWGDAYSEKIGKLVVVLRGLADHLDEDPFVFAVREANRAHRQSGPEAALQIFAAACEIAEGNTGE